MSIKGCVAMILAGGRGERLGALTSYYPKPAIHFGGKYRIIDFTLNNCMSSGIGRVGILSQYFSDDLYDYMKTAYGNVMEHGGIHMLPPRNDRNHYRGTTDAVYKNIGFIERFQPECVLVLAGDHIYHMDYGKMIAFHQETRADVTIASTPVPIQEASRFEILNSDKAGRIGGFEENPEYPRKILASMGVYVFKWDTLKKYLLADNANKRSRHDFERNLLPEMQRAGESMRTYRFKGYWRDIGTVDSLWEANMDQISQPAAPPVRYNRREAPDPYISDMSCLAGGADIRQSIVSEGCSVFGKVEHSILSDQVTVCKGAEVVDSVVMSGAYIGSNAKIYKAVVGTNAVIMSQVVIGEEYGPHFFIDREVCAKGVSLVAPWLYIEKGMRFQAGSHICKERLKESIARENITAELYPPQIAGRHPDFLVRQTP